MKTLKFRINAGTDHYEEDFGPPLPHSLELWEIWGCKAWEHRDTKCVEYNSMVVGGEWKTLHKPIDILRTEHGPCVPNCEYFIHWLAGELERPGKDKRWIGPAKIAEFPTRTTTPSVRRVAGPPAPPYQCGACKERFLDPDDCMIHAFREHPNEL